MIVLLLGCLLKMPYGYYQFIRVAGCVLFIWLAYLENNDKQYIGVIISVLFAILLNPIFKIHFIRSTWNTIDAAMASVLGVWIVIDLIYLLKRKKVKS